MHHVLYAYAVGGSAVGSVVPDSSSEFARCAVCGMHGNCSSVVVTSFHSDTRGWSDVWVVCDSCQYAAEYGCDCDNCAYCAAVDVPLFERLDGTFEAGRRDTEGVKGN